MLRPFRRRIVNDARATVASMRIPTAIIEHAQLTLVRLEQVSRAEELLSDPAPVYYLMGATAQVARSLQRTLDHLGQWWDEQHYARALEVPHGPFANGPEQLSRPPSMPSPPQCGPVLTLRWRWNGLKCAPAISP